MRIGPIVILFGVGMAGCAPGSSVGSPPASGPEPSAATSTRASTYVATLQPTNNAGNRIMGTVRLTPTGERYRAQIEIRNGGGAQNKYPWVIRPGICGQPTGDILADELAYRTLETLGDGSARIDAPLNVTLSDAGRYHVDILKSPNDRQTVVSCGVLSRT